MKHRLTWAALAAATAIVAPASAQTAPLLPLPAQMTPASGSITIANGAGIAAPAADQGAATAARLLADRVKVDRGLTLTPATTGPIRFVRDAAIAGDEAYRLTVTPRAITIAASGDRGLIWGAMTLAQLLSPDTAFGKPVRVAATTINDAPRFRWRGLMVDVTRSFQPIDTLYPVIDTMAAQKLNTLHMHLSDDQGWRVEIKRYPKLTEIGGFRVPPIAGGQPGPKVGGFYTQDELRKLVAYAAERGITIVPEIDMPGHAQAAVAAYPEEVGVLGDRPPVGHDWGVNPWLFSPSPRSMTFIKNVLDELIDIFPGQFIHVGGDEAIKDQWQRSPEVQAQMKALGLKTENQMQGWMISELGKHLASKGRRLIGWDEILEGDVPTSATVMSWRGEAGAVEAANKGHDVVMSPAPNLYLDNIQSTAGDEPPGRIGLQTLEMVYGYEPVRPGVTAEAAAHVLGAQGNAWSEYLATAKQKEHATFPRLSAIAEFTWSPRDKRDWKGFVERLQPQMLRYERQGIAAADAAFAVTYALDGSKGDVLRGKAPKLALTTQTGAGTIRYTTDGSQPTARSRAYAAPIAVKPGQTITAAAFASDGHALARPRAFDATRPALLRATGTADMVACPKGALGLRVPLVSGQSGDAPAYNVNIFDTCTQAQKMPLDVAQAFTVTVARLPRHYGLAHDYKALREHFAVTEHGELVMRTGGCDGTIAATFPLPDPDTAPNRFSFTGTFAKQPGDADVCLQFTSPLSDPFYTVDTLQLESAK
ncbi:MULTISPECIES: beta-N-acetylhexosaminidase [Sphingomonas]|uniref:beta-N-acetylhexosaminidase n=1 Tax=Sphingomonas TaxID=13687 RepID=UPI000A021722|nr:MULTISPECIES: family 20 glycosylhydrolase [Sphingomonas]PZT95603.1 MAG: beta-hexosaminidase [Sphingomonas sp.]RSV26879.1 beta-hexosaminidase [Sphingomonas sp. ABOLH]WCP73116.1 family 20 glycosylhydrolase [Sphingomonas hankookensis]